MTPGPAAPVEARLALVAALSWWLAACAGPARIVEQPASPPRPPVAAKAEPAPPRPAAKPTAAKAERLAAAGKQRQALEEYRSLRERAPGDAAILASHLGTFGAFLRAADADSSRGALAAAGRGYRVLIDGYPHLGATAASLPVDLAALRRKLDSCAERLTSAGLERYRRGDLDGAIRLWREVLTFDPGRGEVRKAIDRAAAQERDLKGAEGATTPAPASTAGHR